MSNFSFFIVPTIICFIVLIGFYKKVNIFDVFLTGAKEGLLSSVSIAPSIIGLVVAVSMLKSSGFFDVISSLCKPFCKILHIPEQVIPLAFLRPVSGSGSLALVDSILATCGADSFPGKVASVMMGSTETTFYTIAIYFGAAGIKKTRHTIKSALIADISSVFLSVFVVYLMFNSGFFKNLN